VDEFKKHGVKKKQRHQIPPMGGVRAFLRQPPHTIPALLESQSPQAKNRRPVPAPSPHPASAQKWDFGQTGPMQNPIDVRYNRDPQMVLARVGPLTINCGTADTFTDAMTDAILAISVELLAAIPEGMSVGLLAWTTASPNSRQRARLSQGPMMRRVKFAGMVSHSTTVRGAVTALNWIATESFASRFFAPREIEKAITWFAKHIELAPTAASECIAACMKQVTSAHQ